MAANHHNDHGGHDVRLPDMNRPGVRHEVSDVDVWSITRFGIGLCALAVISFVLIWVFYRFETSVHGGPAAQTGLNSDARALPPEPRLQVTESLDLKGMLAAQDKLLTSYGWVDQQHGVVRIPIDRAIDVLAQRGLPSRTTSAPASAAANVTVPDESGLGPIMIQTGGPLHAQLANPNAAPTPAQTPAQAGGSH